MTNKKGKAGRKRRREKEEEDEGDEPRRRRIEGLISYHTLQIVCRRVLSLYPVFKLMFELSSQVHSKDHMNSVDTVSNHCTLGKEIGRR